jgi:hypothetical protein
MFVYVRAKYNRDELNPRETNILNAQSRNSKKEGTNLSSYGRIWGLEMVYDTLYTSYRFIDLLTGLLTS